MDDQSLPLGLWTAAELYKIPCAMRGMLSTGAGGAEEPPAICTSNMQLNLQPCLVWLHWQFFNICYNIPYFQGASGSQSMLRVCSYSKRSLSVIDVSVQSYDLQQPLFGFSVSFWCLKAFSRIQLHWLHCGGLTSAPHLRFYFIFCGNTLLGRVRWKFQKPIDGSTAGGSMSYNLKFCGL